MEDGFERRAKRLETDVTSFEESRAEDTTKDEIVDDTDVAEVVMRRNKDEATEDSESSQEEEEEENMDEETSINNSAETGPDEKAESSQDVRLTVTSEDSENVDFSPIEDTSQLDSDLSKQKIVLRKKGSLAKRRKPSRQNVRSAVLSGEESHFQDSTEPRPTSLVVNGYADEDDVFDARDESTSPPHKKPNPTIRTPLPGMTKPLPSPKARRSTGGSSSASGSSIAMDESKGDSQTVGSPAFDSALKHVSKEQKEIENKTALENNPMEFEKPVLRSVPKDIVSTSKSSEEENTFEKPPLRSVAKPEVERKSPEKESSLEIPTLRKTSVTLDEESKSNTSRTPSGLFDVPALKSTPKAQTRQTQLPDSDTKGTFNVPSLRNVERTPAKREQEVTSDIVVVEAQSPKFPIPALRNVLNTPAKEENTENRGDVTDSGSKTFEIPTLRSVPKSPSNQSLSGGSDVSSGDNKDSEKGDKPAWFTDMKLRKTKSPPENLSEKMQQEKEPEKPSWMKTAMEKKSKALEVLQAKENKGKNSPVDEKASPWADQARLRRTPNAVPLKEGSDDENKVNYRHSMPPDIRGRLSSTGSDKDASSKAPTERDNYSPSWLKGGDNRRQSTSSVKPTPSKFSGPPAVLSGPISHEIPDWKKALAEKNKARRESDIKVTPVKSDESIDTGTPQWKLEFAQKRKRTSVTPKASSETVAQEPEWKRQAEERRARILKGGLIDAKANK